MRQSEPIRVLVVASSAVLRAAIAGMLRTVDDVSLVASVDSAAAARPAILQHKPDVVLVDLELPRGAALILIQVLREHYPVPVVGLAPADGLESPTALRAIELGAVDVIRRPQTRRWDQDAAGLAACVRQAHGFRPAALTTHPLRRDRAAGPSAAAETNRATGAGPELRLPPVSPATPPSIAPAFGPGGPDPAGCLVAIGASTGGTDALLALLRQAPPDFPPTVIVQHMPAGFTRAFAGRLDRHCAIRVREAADGDRLEPGLALLARGEIQMGVTGRPGCWYAHHGSTHLFNRHCPSVDVLFATVARRAGPRGVGVLLTGMGDDGAHGLSRMRTAGAITIAQDRASCVVYGMPRVATEMGIVQHIAPPEQIAGLIVRLLRDTATVAG